MSVDRVSAAFLFFFIVFTSAAAADDCAIEYRQFKTENASCDAAIIYKTNPAGLDVIISVIAYGKGPESGDWRVADISLNIDSARIGPDASGKFYVKKDRLLEYPAGVVYAAMDTQIEAMGLFEVGIASDKFRDPGLGLLHDQTTADISGENRLFALSWDTVEKIYEGRDSIEVMIEDPLIKAGRIIKIDLMKGPAKEARFEYGKLRQDELMQIVDTLRGQIANIENNRLRYKEGVDPEYAEMQSKIEDLEVERAVAYKTWFERRQAGGL